MVLTDNNPLKYISTAKLGTYEQKWAAQLTDFDFEIKYRPGKLYTNADVLSRLYSDNVDILSECIHGSAISLEINQHSPRLFSLNLQMFQLQRLILVTPVLN